MTEWVNVDTRKRMHIKRTHALTQEHQRTALTWTFTELKAFTARLAGWLAGQKIHLPLTSRAGVTDSLPCQAFHIGMWESNPGLHAAN